MAAPATGEELMASARPRSRPRRLPPHWRPAGMVSRILVTVRHLLGLLFGGYLAWVEARRGEAHGFWWGVQQLFALLVRPWVARDLARRPFPEQLRRRLEMLGPTYVKLGQIMAVRRDLLPESVTSELEGLLDRVPAVPFDAIREIVELDLGRPLEELFAAVDPDPLGSASIAQTHRATTRDGQDVILKVVKPGIRVTIKRDAAILRTLGRLLQILIPTYQPRRIIDEFCHYTIREADMECEAENAEILAGNFEDMPAIVFPAVYRELSGRDVLCMEFLDGIRPDTATLAGFEPEERELLVHLGAAAIIRMVYLHGFFHADLHPGNLRILPGPKLGFIDLGMVGRLDPELRRTLLHYLYCVLMGDDEAAARYLASAADPGPGADPTAFRREVALIARTWRRARSVRDFSVAQLILLSVRQGARFGLYFPVEMVLMVKALVTYEGMGTMVDPEFNPLEVARPHVLRVFREQLSPWRLLREGVRGAPEIMDAFIKLPILVTEGVRFLDERRQRPPDPPLSGLRGTVFGGFCLVAGAILAGSGAPWPLWGGLIALGLLLQLNRG